MRFSAGAHPKPERTPEAVMTLTEHLAELRTRIIRCARSPSILGAILIMAFYNQVIRFLAQPYKELCEERGTRVLCPGPRRTARSSSSTSTRWQACRPVSASPCTAASLIAIPIIMWQIWKFVVPALKSNEKKYAVPFITSSVSLFALGGFLAYLTLGQGARVPDLLGR